MATTRRSGWAFFFFIVVIAGTLFAFLKGAVSPPKEPVRIAFQVCNSLDENVARFTPLARYLEEELGRRVKVFHVNTYDFLERAEKGEFDFIQSNGYIYVLIKERLGAKLVAREVKIDTGKDTGGLIVVRSDSPIKKISDLHGKRFVFGPVLSPGGYMCQYYVMLEAGFDPENDLEGYYFLKGSHKHEKVVYGVYFGAFDAGAVKFGDLERMEREGKIRRSDFRVIAKSPPVPNCTFYALPNVPDSLVGEVRRALLSLDESDTVEVNGEVLNVLLRDGIEGYVPAEDGEFDVLRKIAKRLKMPPYEEP